MAGHDGMFEGRRVGGGKTECNLEKQKVRCRYFGAGVNMRRWYFGVGVNRRTSVCRVEGMEEIIWHDEDGIWREVKKICLGRLGL